MASYLPGRLFSGSLFAPYATEPVYLAGQVIFPGSYDDRDLLRHVPSEFIAQKRILDVGSGCGSRALLLIERGAEFCVGLEIRRRLADMAVRAAMIEGLWPKVTFFRSSLRQYANDLEHLIQFSGSRRQLIAET